ncbi:MAG TPA: hypothetical protein VED24_03975 [Candidatus Acidoferrum sp.]|nr:hypothetical protein [Candidatus Acidoferrum sp.]
MTHAWRVCEAIVQPYNTFYIAHVQIEQDYRSNPVACTTRSTHNNSNYDGLKYSRACSLPEALVAFVFTTRGGLSALEEINNALSSIDYVFIEKNLVNRTSKDPEKQ